jgi:hypothetical protein
MLLDPRIARASIVRRKPPCQRRGAAIKSWPETLRLCVIVVVAAAAVATLFVLHG